MKKSSSSLDKNLLMVRKYWAVVLGCQISNLNTQYDIKKFYLGFKKQFDFFDKIR